MKTTCSKIILATRKKGEHMVIESDYDGYYLQRVFNASKNSHSYISYDPNNRTEWQNSQVVDHDGLNTLKSQLLNIGYRIDWNAFNFLLLKKQLSWGDQ